MGLFNPDLYGTNKNVGNISQNSVFEVVKPIEVQAGKIASWFNQPAGGIQYMLPDTVDELFNPNVGVLRRLQ